MAQITGAQNERVFSIQKWLGLNQNPDGDTKLKMGEAASMRNWKVTRDGNLQKRPGTREVLHIGAEPVEAVWTGFVAEQEVVMAVCGGKLYRCAQGGTWSLTEIGTVTVTVASHKPHMFGFGGKLWLIAYGDYYCWDGVSFGRVEGYVPLVAVSIPPTSGGELLEQVNKLSGKRRAWISPDGTGTKFLLPEDGTITAIDYVKNLGTDTDVPTTDYTVDLAEGSVTFASAPAESVNSYEIAWTVSETFRSEVTAMCYSETYNGTQDTRVFLYGDGGSEALYSEVDYLGIARADYFPDLNEVRVGVKNTPITGMIRQYSRLVVFKTDGAWSIQYGTITDADGSAWAGFYVSPLNRTIGNDAMGQVQLVLNNPVTLFGSDLYEWKSGSFGNLTNDERQARRISDRVYQALSEMGLRSCRAYDDNYHQEYYIFSPSTQEALCWNYAADAWYYYDSFPMYNPFVYRGELYYGSMAGGIQHVSTNYAYDKIGSGEVQPIDCYWSSGSMSFGADYQRKYSAMIWLGIKPETKGEVWVTVETDKSVSYQEKVVTSALFGFDNVDFEDFTFETNRKPQMKRLKIKAKKFVFYNLILKSNNANAGATVTSADMRVRFTGYSK